MHIPIDASKPVAFTAVISTIGWADELFDLINKCSLESTTDFISLDKFYNDACLVPMSIIDDMRLLICVSAPMIIKNK